MFMIDDKPLALDVPFTIGEGDTAVQYPANFLRLSSPEERAAIGITEVADPVPHDDRFYWAPGVPKQLEDRPEVDEDGKPVLGQDGKQLVTRGLKSTMVAQVKQTAASLLAPTDWRVVRAAEGVKPCDDATLASRAAIRAASDANEASIMACETVDELAALQFSWPA